LCERQINVAVFPDRTARRIAQRQVAELDDVVAVLWRRWRLTSLLTAEYEFNSTQQNGKASGLFDKIDRAAKQASLVVNLGSEDRQEYHWDINFLFSHLTQHVDSSQSRHLPVEQYEVDDGSIRQIADGSQTIT